MNHHASLGLFDSLFSQANFKYFDIDFASPQVHDHTGEGG